MDTYSLLREFADSWFLIFMFAFFVGVWVFAFWPSLKADRDAAASIVLRDDTFDDDPGPSDTTDASSKGQNDG
ncbi:MAG: cbb3-type cytochrome c oxidase subunit 3 [Pseudomonadota bacterium]